jgi:hypothetical protein
LFQHDEVVIAILSLLFMILKQVQDPRMVSVILSLLFMILKQVQDLRMVSVILSLSQELILMSLLGLGSETSSA